MQERVAAFNAASRAPVVLKLGLHEGPCIAVNLNDRLDYFGGPSIWRRGCKVRAEAAM